MTDFLSESLNVEVRDTDPASTVFWTYLDILKDLNADDPYMKILERKMSQDADMLLVAQEILDRFKTDDASISFRWMYARIRVACKRHVAGQSVAALAAKEETVGSIKDLPTFGLF